MSADPELRSALSRAASALPLDVEEGLKEVHRQGRIRSRLHRTSTVIIATIVTGLALLVVALLLPLRREVRPGAAGSPGKVAYTRVTGTGQIIDWEAFVLNEDGSGTKSNVSGPGASFAPAFSPDGRSVAFISADEDGSNPELWIARADGSEARPIVADPPVSADSSPAWSPDGERIAFVASERRGGTVWVVNSDGSGARRLLEGSWSQVSWSPDGARLALAGFPGQAGRPSLYVVGVDGSGLVRLVTFQGAGAFPTWSPDGRHIAYMALDPESGGFDYAYDVFVVNVGGSGLVRLTTWEGFDGFPVWSPDGSRILFSSDRGATEDQLDRNRAGEGWFGASLFIMRPDGSAPRLLLAADAPHAALLPTSWAA